MTLCFHAQHGQLINRNVTTVKENKPRKVCDVDNFLQIHDRIKSPMKHLYKYHGKGPVGHIRENRSEGIYYRNINQGAQSVTIDNGNSGTVFIGIDL